MLLLYKLTKGQIMQIQNGVPTTLQPSNVSAPAKGVSQEQDKKATQSVAKEVKVDTEKANQKDLKQELQNIVAALNKEMAPMNSDIKFGFQEEAKTFYVSVVDVKNDQIIRKYPSDEAMQLMSKMREVVGSIFDQKG